MDVKLHQRVYVVFFLGGGRGGGGGGDVVDNGAVIELNVYLCIVFAM